VAIKRTTVELNDAPDKRRNTSVPESLQRPKGRDLKIRDQTSTFAERPEEEPETAKNGSVSPRAPQRTIADLVVEVKSDQRVMATLLMFLPMVPSSVSGNLKTESDFLISLAYGVVLNLVWFGGSILQWWLGRQK